MTKITTRAQLETLIASTIRDHVNEVAHDWDDLPGALAIDGVVELIYTVAPRLAKGGKTTLDELAELMEIDHPEEPEPVPDAGEFEEAFLSAEAAIVALSQWVDRHNSGKRPEHLRWVRIGKLAEELGEATGALIAWEGSNPRKAKAEDWVEARDALAAELLDIQLTAAAAWVNVTDRKHPLAAFAAFVESRRERWA